MKSFSLATMKNVLLWGKGLRQGRTTKGHRDEEEEGNDNDDNNTTKDALERALSRHEKYVSSSSEGRFAEDLGMHLLSFVLSLSAVKNELTRKSISSLCKAENRKDATRKVAKLTSTLVSGINRGVLEVFENQKEVEKEAKVLQKKVDAFKCESRTWVKSLRDFDESLKSIGDFENYVMTLENELKGIAEELKKRKEQ